MSAKFALISATALAIAAGATALLAQGTNTPTSSGTTSTGTPTGTGTTSTGTPTSSGTTGPGTTKAYQPR